MNTSHLIVDVPTQQMHFFCHGKLLKSYLVSTGVNGLGEQKGSGKTPRGWHIIRAKIGTGQPCNAVFVGRRPTGEIYTPELSILHPDRDWILSRILWLSGLELGKNRLGDCDTMQRYIYIHGCPSTKPMGIPDSKGCIRMQNTDLIELFDRVEVGTKIFIQENEG